MEPSRSISTRRLIAGLIAQAPLALKNFHLYFSNLYRRKILRTNIVKPYALIFYATHKCNLACAYCTQKEPDVFSEELPTRETLRLLRLIRRETDSIVFTGGEPTLRPDIVELVTAARRDMRFRSVMLITNGTLLDRRSAVFEHLTGLVISLDALTMDPTNPLSKPAALPKVMENIALAKSCMPHPRTITISTVIEEWNIGEIERILDWAGEQGFVFATQAALNEKLPNLRLIENQRYLELVRKIIDRRKRNAQPINGTPRTIETLLRFGDFQCFPTMFPRVYPNGDVFYPCEPLRKIGGNLLREGSLAKVFARGKRLYGDIPECHGICHLFGNVISHYYANDFWRLAGDYIR